MNNFYMKIAFIAILLISRVYKLLAVSTAAFLFIPTNKEV